MARALAGGFAGQAGTRRARALLGAVAVLLTHSACATVPPSLPSPPSDAQRDAIRTVAVVSAARLLAPPAEPPGSMSRAASGGAAGGMRMTGGSIIPAGALLLPIAVPAGALIGMAIYAARSPSESELAASRAALARLFEGFDLQDQLRTQTVHFAGAHAERAVRAPGAMPAGGGAESADRGRSEADAIIEVAADGVALEQVWDTRPDLGLAVAARARLVSRGRELYAVDMTYRAGARPLVEWTADECRALRQELLRAAEALAERVVDEMFLVERGR